MRKLLLAFMIALLSLQLGIAPARADGGIFPTDLNTGYLAVRYHHVTVTITEGYAVTYVEQKFYNPYNFPVESRYLFPVPPGAAITGFTATLDGQPQAVTHQDTATTNADLYGMVTQFSDPSLLQYADWETLAFDLSLPAFGSRKMTLRYEEVLTPASGLYHYRYVLSTERYSSQPLDEVSLTVNLALSAGLANVYSSSHPVTVETLGPGQVRVAWQAKAVTPSEDFDLFFAPANGGFGGGLLTGRRLEQDHFLFLFSPDLAAASKTALPKDIVFVIDRSGSMSGEKIEQVRNALHYFIDQLGAADRFSVVSFNDELTVAPDVLSYPEADRVQEMHRFVDGLTADGSTNIEGALQAALDVLARSEPRTGAPQIVVFLTDGLPTAGITDDGLIVQQVAQTNAEIAARLHTFGVGYDVNTHLLDRLSADNGGSVTYIQPGENLEAILTSFYDRIAYPVLTDIHLEFEGLAVSDLYPQTIPDLFQGSSLLLTGRYQATGQTSVVRVRGQAGGAVQEFVYTFDLAQTGGHDFVPRLWATRRVGALLDQVRIEGESEVLVEAIRDLGLGYGIVTPYTNFIITAQATGAASMNNMNLYADSTALNQASGQVTIQARVQNQAYQQANQASLATGANIVNSGQNSFAQLTDPVAQALNVDMAILQGQKDWSEPVTLAWIQDRVPIDRTIIFGSEGYFELAKNPDIRPFLQSGVNVIFAYGGEIIQVLDDSLPNQAAIARPPTARPIWAVMVEVATWVLIRLIAW
jgi:Ca-activated chloride channel family protein